MGSSSTYRIPLSAPCLIGKEREYLSQALDQNQLTAGAFVERFEQAFAEYVGATYAIATSSGTTALHLALLGTRVLFGQTSFSVDMTVPTLTYIAAPNVIRYCGGDPGFLDADPVTWQATALPSTRSLPHLAVHLYGVAAPIPTDRIVVEDCAEALGTRVGGQHVGTFGVAGAFSFYGNKVITTGEGGMVVTNDPQVADRVRLLRGQGMDPARRYYHPVVGFNYRMTNLQAAVGLGQLEVIETLLERRRNVRRRYAMRLFGLWTTPEGFHADDTSPWLMAGVFTTVNHRLNVEQALTAAGIESRPLFYPCHHQPPYATEHANEQCPVAWDLYQRGLCLPLHPAMSFQDVDDVCRVIREAIGASR